MDSPIYYDIRNAAKQHVLSREEEFFIFGRLRALQKKPGRSEDEEKEIREIVDTIVTCNIRFAVSVAQGFEKKGSTPVDDLISLCAIGLLSAIDCFDHASGNKFITYAVWHMKNQIYKAHLQDKQTSAHFYNRITQIDKDIDINAASFKAKDALQKAGISEEILASYNFVQHKPISLDAKYTTYSNEYTLMEIIPDEQSKTPEEEYILDQEKKLLHDEIDKILDFRSAYVVKAIHGLSGGEPINLKQVGDDIGCSREMARKIYVDALKILKQSEVLKSIFNP